MLHATQKTTFPESDHISRPDGAGLAEYLRSLERISSALSRLQATNLRSNQEAITDFTRLVRTGSQQLEGVFQETLREDLRGIEPLFYITKSMCFVDLYNFERC